MNPITPDPTLAAYATMLVELNKELDTRTPAERAYDEHLANGIATAKQVLRDAGLDTRLLFD